MRWLMPLTLCLISLCTYAGPPAQTLTPIEPRPPAPDFELADIDGNRYKLSDLRGKVVIVNFWATWCPPCRQEMPSMQRAWEQLREERILMLAINVGEDEDSVFMFTADTPIEFPLLLDPDGKATKQWPVIGLPSTFAVDREGRIAYQAIGGREWDDPKLLNPIRALAHQEGHQ
jgi:peroxiredoxin